MLSTASTETKQLTSSPPGSLLPGGDADNKQTTKCMICQMGIDAKKKKKGRERGRKCHSDGGKGVFYSAALRQASLEKRLVGNEAVGPQDV